MVKKLICFSIVVHLASLSKALPSRNWASSGWTTEPSHRSGWEKTEVNYHDTWKQPVGEDTQGKGWVSSESANDSKTKAIPTSWQQVERHHGESVKSSGWTNVGQKTALSPPSQDIANGIVVHHPVPNSNKWTQSSSSLDAWKNQNAAEEYWSNKKADTLPPPAVGWEKTAADEQWQQNQDPSSPWEKSPEASGNSVWNKDSSPSAWESDAVNDRESAAGYAATGPAQYRQGAAISSWQEKPSTNGWQKDSLPAADAWKKDSPPPSLYDAPSKWESKPASGNSEWQKASASSSNGWDSSSDFKTWQQETNGWTSSATNVQNHPAVGGWHQGTSDVTAPKPWKDDAVSNGWQKSTSAMSNSWDNQG